MIRGGSRRPAGSRPPGVGRSGDALPTVRNDIDGIPVGNPSSHGRLEDEAFDRLRVLDVAACRTRLASLADRMVDAAGDGSLDRRVCVLALHDVIQDVHRRLHRPDPAGGTEPERRRYRELRWEILEAFSRADRPVEARDRFLRFLDRLLDGWCDRNGDVHPIVQRARVFIRENYHERVSLSSVAGHLNVSSNYLSRQFRRETGMTLTSYIQRVRLSRARELLADPGRTIAEIAYQVGYQNYRDFYRNFVKYENASPSQVQRRLIRTASRV